ncbi:ubiquitin-binding SDF ubiquitin ligase complex subunit met30 [Coemansia sp. RSA 989]|nr:ubiquitin-binding SDF ubiquitin ligase complex subunit met30 [Coemansia sp. RSA 1821]KAJ1868117.1 ubiquitin-binding SDF ubiquitin ligase complex subunit met30 [Coemansia sp. RSA 989]KAJ1875053.1 ubiquitin-binding SDF ubiquitin ligase complex subunit met30 [Coemansia sp. RSA 990]KAJ2653427.1 ubiquitin-binding SDF ubiquitin ligase complex subunit met30 [Coemansia sp. RSA 1250]KAJ2676355.1 ubiquitin-binding SDF ubiquitin ligase complex subunit met30 [Coemansia sp. RSA 1085]
MAISPISQDTNVRESPKVSTNSPKNNSSSEMNSITSYMSQTPNAHEAALPQKRKRNYTEHISRTSLMDVESTSLGKYPVFGGKCYRHTAQVYLAECSSTHQKLQEALAALPQSEQTKISGIWRDFASETAERRLLILQGLVNLCCIPQLSYLNRVVPEQLRVDFMAAAPPDIALKILSYLDAKSLCQAAQVSRTWAALANDDILWHRMCAQHIDKVCKKCGWGLPLLDRTSRRVYEATARRALKLAANAPSAYLPSSHGIINGQTAAAAQPTYSFVLPASNVAIDAAMPMSSQAVPYRQTIPVSSLINPTDLSGSLVSSVCAPQDSVQFMDEMQGSDSNASGKLMTPQEAFLRVRRIDSGDSSDSNSVGDGASCASAEGSKSRGHLDGSNNGRPRRRPWKEIFAERQIIANNWRKFRFRESQFQAHADGILCVQFNDSYMITGSYDSKLHVWDSETFELVQELTGHTMPVRALEFDDCKLFSGSLDGTVKIWNYRAGTCIRTLQAFDNGGVISLHHQKGTLVVGGENGTIRVYNIAKMTSFTLTGHTDWVNAVRLYGENTLYSCSDDMRIKRWDLEKRQCVRTFTGHTHHVQSLQLSSRGPADISAATNSQLPSLRRRNNGISDEDARPYMITGSLDSTMRVWDIETGECLSTIFGHVEGIWSMAFDALRIVSGSNDGTIKVWDTTSHTCLYTFQNNSVAVNCVALSDTRIVVGDNDGNVRVFDFRNDRIV